MRGIFIDGFAGGGGASTGIAQALGRDVDIAINHSPSAIAIHKANHPDTEHHCQDIRAVWPRMATRGRPVAGTWFSPDCKEFSKAKGGAVKERHIRMLAMEIPHWLEEAEPEVVYVENVEEFEDWGPLEQGDDGKWRVITELKGEDFKKWLRLCRRAGYRVDYRQLRACDYGAPTSRKRLYIVMRRDKKPIRWPKPTHGRPDSPGVRSGRLLPYRTAAECIDWSIPCPSIFDRRRELAEATKRRIAHGVMRYVVNAARPFIVGTAFTNTRASRVFDPQDPLRTATTQSEYGVVDVEIAPHVMTNRNAQKPFTAADEPTHTITAGGAHLNVVQASLVSYGQHGGANRPVDEPHHTIAASKKDTNGVVGATMVKMGNGEREGQEPRALDIGKPFHTVTAKGSQAAAVTAFLSQFAGSDRVNAAGDPEQPLRTVRTGAGKGGGHHAVVAAHIEQANTGMVGHMPRKPLSTIVGKGCTQRIVETTMIEEGALPPEMMERAVKVAAFLVKYYGEGGQDQAADRPLDVVTTRARYAVVTVTIDAVTYVIVDIGLRMLKPRELARAQGFPEDYVLDPIVRKVVRGKLVERRLTIAEQISAIGNSVCPPVARALVAANQPELAEIRMAA